MIRHFLKIAYRNGRKKTLFSVLNIAGLSIGIASFLVITLYVFQETSYEKGFADHERTYRLEKHLLSMGRVAWSGSNLQFVLDEVPEIEAHARIQVSYGMEIVEDENYYETDKTIWTDNKFFDVFDYKVILGNPEAPLTGPGSVVLTRVMAEKVFGSTDVIGKELKLNRSRVYLISAVIEKPLIKSHLDFDMLIHRQNEEAFSPGAWYSVGGYTYAKLAEGMTQASLDEKLTEIAKAKIFPVVTGQEEGLSFDDWISQEDRISYFSQPIDDIHLESKLNYEIDAGGDKQALLTLGLIALFILIIASINFMNLTTARSSTRTKEIGIRKVLGTRKKGLIIQFLTETMLLTVVATVIGAALAEGTVYLINQEFGNVLGISLTKYPSLLLNVGIGVVLLGLISGLYPAFYLSSARIIPLLKGMKLSRVLNLNLAKGLRNGLVVVQFTLSTGLIIASLFIYNQLIFLQNKDLGFDMEQSIVIGNVDDLKMNKLAFKNEILNIPGVEGASFTQRVPGDDFNGTHSVKLDFDRSVVMSTFVSDLDLFETLGLELADGDWFSPELVKTDSNVVLNEAAALAIGIEDPVGKLFGNYYRIVGVVKDFNYGSYKEGVGPAIFSYSQDNGNRLVIRLDTEQAPMEQIKEVWSKFTSERIATHWVQQNFENLLEKENQMANIVAVFTTLAILISCIGLFGLAAFTADQRLHEFGIRKVLGATVNDVVRHFSFDFLRLIMIAFLISIPLSVWGVDAWLQGYADRISLRVDVFILAGILAFAIAFFTILFQSIKTGRLNPVDTIKNE
ncbi:MAG: FtsX-like permease family protein [Roseivirga sp.]|nr:FtsX-like permease family protein [Roseivirga sp.]